MSALRDLISRKSRTSRLDAQAKAAGDMLEDENNQVEPQNPDENLQLSLTALQAKLRESKIEPDTPEADVQISRDTPGQSDLTLPRPKTGVAPSGVRTSPDLTEKPIDQSHANGSTSETYVEQDSALIGAILSESNQTPRRDRTRITDLSDLDAAVSDIELDRQETNAAPESALSQRIVPSDDSQPDSINSDEASGRLATSDETEIKPFSQANSIETTTKPNDEAIRIPAPIAGRSGKRAGRVKTRLLGFEHSHESDPFVEKPPVGVPENLKFPVGWMVVIEGPGRGTFFPIFNGVSQIGRGDDQAIRLNFGDNSISRHNHAAVAYDSENRGYFLGHGGKANLVRLNNNPVLSTEKMSNNDLIRIGETTLRFVGLCDEKFDWNYADQDDDAELI